MKKCNNCGAQLEEDVKYCSYCGSANLEDVVQSEGQTASEEQTAATEGLQFEGTPVFANQAVIEPDDGIDKNGNVLAGAVGALLFSVIGGVIYFLVYQLGFIAGICGLVTFILASFGYDLFAKPKGKNSIAGLISAIIATLVMIFVAEYLCISYEIFQVFKEEGITFFDAVRATPDFLTEPELMGAVVKDIAMSYLFTFLACINNISNIIKANKKKK